MSDGEYEYDSGQDDEFQYESDEGEYGSMGDGNGVLHSTKEVRAPPLPHSLSNRPPHLKPLFWCCCCF